MASIFSYEPDPPRVASPWLQGIDESSTQKPTGHGQTSNLSPAIEHLSIGSNRSLKDKVRRLQAEPQEGPVEYKLHLLLRSRRNFKFTSTGIHISGSKHVRPVGVPSDRRVSDSAVDGVHTSGFATPPTASTHQTRQHRLEQLTTQLLWRLQQSSPHHSSSADNIILPSLPEALPELEAPQQPSKLLHGLEESQGALYEIGVSDDGTLIGLADDEMSESLNNLRAMAACLGCTVDVLRMEEVGRCEWYDDVTVSGEERKVRRNGKLVVAEALVKPFLQPKSPAPPGKDTGAPATKVPVDAATAKPIAMATEQLRISLTGPTMCGKSTLLGTLTTSTLDNGKGKSRLSMLKHRHEITSGVTSSITQELIGYRDVDGGSIEVVNYATENIASWIDVHVAAAGSRLLFISDSAGHPRYRRTTLRGLMGCAPHWTLLCIPADGSTANSDNPSDAQLSHQGLGTVVSDMDLSAAQLDLCLRLALPMIVIITKLDLASRAGLRETLVKVLDALKAAGKKPAIVPNKPGTVSEEDLHYIQAHSVDDAYNMAVPLLNDVRETVPIVLTSAVDGTGIANLHALLHEVPIPEPKLAQEASLDTIFDIEDIYSKPAEISGVIVSGRLRAGTVSIGDSIVVGPFAGHDQYEDSEDSDERSHLRPSSHLPTSRSFPGAIRDSHLNPRHFHLPEQEWRRMKVTSIRNLRLPVHTLQADQAGTIAISLDTASGQSPSSTAALLRIRKGMVLAAIQPAATRTFTARFKREDLESLAVGNHVVVYISSVRASARVVSAQAPDSPDMSPLSADRHDARHADDEPFALDESGPQRQSAAEAIRVAGVVTAPELLVTLAFDASKEFVLLGDKVLVMPGGGPGLYGGHGRGEKGIAGLDGFVGEIVECRS